MEIDMLLNKKQKVKKKLQKTNKKQTKPRIGEPLVSQRPM